MMNPDNSKECQSMSQPSEPKPLIKHDWYQTESHITVNVLLKNQDEDKVKVVFGEMFVNITLPSKDLFSLNLAKQIDPSKCTHRTKPTKIELKIKKLNEELWTALEAKPKDPGVCLPQLNTRCNWDKFVETELKDDSSQGDAALNELFQKIYTEGSDEVKKAMNKSFLESGGTVLSTNWNEVGEKKVDIKPPDGMEWKKWEES